ncbi:MAG: hypothetical protein EOP24_27535 [Hyphomicrobiales bacterium]|nr:MAG: hypothetical protein EOP24_27535 [Hyphomicrobiales bacterium]
MTPNDMPGASTATLRRRVRVTHELGTGGPIRVVIGRLVIDEGESSGVLPRRGLLELHGEYPTTNDCAIAQKFIVSIEFVDPHAPIAEIARSS